MKHKLPALKHIHFSPKETLSAITQNALLLIDLHMSNQCNLKCPGCYRDAGRSLSDELTYTECCDVLTQAKELGARTWVVTGSGEPFLDKKFRPLVTYANSLGLGVIVFTNNTSITPEIALWISRQNMSVVAKINSFLPHVQDEIVGVTGAHTHIYAGLRHLMNVGLHKSGRLGLDSVIVRQNYKEIPTIFRFCRDNGIVPYITTELHGGRGVINAPSLDIDVTQIRKMFFHLRDIDNTEYGYDWEPHPPVVVEGSCKKILYQLHVGPTGSISICPGIRASLGNVRQMSLMDAVMSDLVQKVRHLNMPSCPICKEKRSSIQKCTGGCLLSKEHSGNMFGTDPQCCW
ncbi:MAG: radical SAM protein [Candidatus Yonathbacteria bacterium]|nr:radical SAM protein [Candidatus Yonathbacteria bacterium]